MALRALMLSKTLSEKKKALEELRSKIAGFAQREAELEKAIEEAETDEEKAVVEEAVTAFEADKAEAEEAEANLDAEVRELEAELDATETKEEPKAEERSAVPVIEKRKKEIHIMNKRFRDMTFEERTRLVQRDDMQEFLGQVRSAIKEQRALTNVGYLIPDVFLGILKAAIEDYSKLYNRVYKEPVSGPARLVIEGPAPEAVWTEACANLNELDLSWSKAEIDGYKVGGYFKVCNAIIEDADIDLAGYINEKLGQAIGLAIDKAIVFGTGTKMPTGIVPTLKAVGGTPNVVSHANTVTGKALVEALIDDASLITSQYGSDLIWIMNKKTKLQIRKNMLNVDSAGLFVAGNEFPVIGGDIIELNFMPNNVIVGGYADLYLLGERKGIELNTSEHAFWVADQTGFKGTARYDGKPLDANGFVAIGINGADGDDMVVTFPQDGANL